jgi:hypothetical protein
MSDYVGAESMTSLREQLRLFAFNGAPYPTPPSVLRAQNELGKRQRLAALLEGELDFHSDKSGYASHDLHAFAAKFPPQLPRAFIRGLTLPGEIVLDPMMGSGTTLVEALLEGRQGVGLDLDPLALQLGCVKTMPIEVDSLRQAGHRVLRVANDLLSDSKGIESALAHQFDDRTRDFVDYWFLPTTQRELLALALAIREMENPLFSRLTSFAPLRFGPVLRRIGGRC